MSIQPIKKPPFSANQDGKAPQVVEFILKSALQLNASDIHIGKNNTGSPNEPYLLRFRVNGKLQKANSVILNDCYTEVIARIKVLSKMDITSTESQNGVFSLVSGMEKINYRVNTTPGTNSTEEVCIRLQREKGKDIELDDMVMTANMRNQLEQLIHQQSGMFIMNGPAGQGKTTTIYAILRKIAGPDRKIVTAEDPVERELPYVTHNQISSSTSFADLSRSFMRQDAEVIFLGEIRDEESALAATQLAQTGHLVVSTLHTRDSLGVIGRLGGLGVDNFTIASTLIGSLAQRLVPALCPHCKVPAELDASTTESLDEILSIPQGTVIFEKGPGCEHCNKYIGKNLLSSGVIGGIPIFELFVVDDEISDLINERKSRSEILSVATNKGMLTLPQEALLRVYQGLVDLNSVKNIVIKPSY